MQCMGKALCTYRLPHISNTSVHGQGSLYVSSPTYQQHISAWARLSVCIVSHMSATYQCMGKALCMYRLPHVSNISVHGQGSLYLSSPSCQQHISAWARLSVCIVSLMSATYQCMGKALSTYRPPPFIVTARMSHNTSRLRQDICMSVTQRYTFMHTLSRPSSNKTCSKNIFIRPL